MALAALLRVGAGLYLVSAGLISRRQGTLMRTAKVGLGMLVLFLPALVSSWPSA
jgi:hypothetical protein